MPCMVCGKTDGEESFVLCDGCEEGGGRAWQILLATSLDAIEFITRFEMRVNVITRFKMRVNDMAGEGLADVARHVKGEGLRHVASNICLSLHGGHIECLGLPAIPQGDWQGLTLVPSSAQLKRLLCDRGCS